MGRMSPRPTSPFSGPAQQGLNLMDSGPLALDGLAASLAQVTADLQSSGDEWDVPPGIQVTRREFHHAVSQAARDLGVTQVGGDRISPLELSPSYLARRDDSSEVLSAMTPIGGTAHPLGNLDRVSCQPAPFETSWENWLTV